MREVTALGNHLMQAVGRLIPVLPVPLVARVLLAADGQTLSELEIKSRVGAEVERLTARGGRLVNVDVTLICERPKVKPHRQAMRERLAELLSLPLDAVSVKATTTEAMGFTGRGEGLAAQALATIELTGA